MSSEIKWYVENRVLLVTHHDTFTVDDAVFLTTESVKYLDECNYPLHFISDHRGTTGMGAELQRISELLKYARPFFTHTNLGMVVGYGFGNGFIKFLASMAGQLTSKDYHLVKTEDEAIQYIAHNDEYVLEALHL